MHSGMYNQQVHHNNNNPQVHHNNNSRSAPPRDHGWTNKSSRKFKFGLLLRGAKIILEKVQKIKIIFFSIKIFIFY